MLPASVSFIALMLQRAVASLTATPDVGAEEEPTRISPPSPPVSVDAEPEPVVWRPRPDKRRSPEVRFLIHDAAQCQRQGDLVGAALRVNVLVTLCAQDDVYSEWLVNLRRRIDLENEQDRAIRETGYQTIALSAETVQRLVALSQGRAPCAAEPVADPEVANSLALLDGEARPDLTSSIDASGLANSLVFVRRR